MRIRTAQKSAAAFCSTAMLGSATGSGTRRGRPATDSGPGPASTAASNLLAARGQVLKASPRQTPARPPARPVPPRRHRRPRRGTVPRRCPPCAPRSFPATATPTAKPPRRTRTMPEPALLRGQRSQPLQSPAPRPGRPSSGHGGLKQRGGAVAHAQAATPSSVSSRAAKPPWAAEKRSTQPDRRAAGTRAVREEVFTLQDYRGIA